MSQKPQLSIIIPCFNAAQTLPSTLDSLRDSQITTSFEVIAVDDASTDESNTILTSYKETLPLSIISHTQNKGGGAARNTGIAHAKGEYIYCLDSDNILEKHSLQQLVDYLEHHQLDGACFHQRRFFVSNPRIVTHVQSNQTDKVFSLADYFNSSGVVLDNFLFTKSAYQKVGGYPEHHGFDTQAFELKFVAAGLKVQTCPGSIFFHRQRGSHLSYFERVYESGEYSLNFYLVFEEFIEKFSSEVIEEIISFPVFTKNGIEEGSIFHELCSMYQKQPETFFAQTRTSTKTKEFVEAVKAYKKGNTSKAQRLYEKLLSHYPESVVLVYNILRCVICQNLKQEQRLTEKTVFSLLKQMQPKAQKSFIRQSLLTLAIKKVKRSLW